MSQLHSQSAQPPVDPSQGELRIDDAASVHEARFLRDKFKVIHHPEKVEPNETTKLSYLHELLERERGLLDRLDHRRTTHARGARDALVT